MIVAVMSRVESIWLRIIAVLLILLGLVLLVSPAVTYSTKEQFGNTPLRIKREKTVAIPWPVAVLVISAGVVAFIGAGRSSKSPS